MYWRDKWDFTESIEYEYKFAGNYGAKGEKRQKKRKPHGSRSESRIS